MGSLAGLDPIEIVTNGGDVCPDCGNLDTHFDQAAQQRGRQADDPDPFADGEFERHYASFSTLIWEVTEPRLPDEKPLPLGSLAAFSAATSAKTFCSTSLL